MDPMMTSASDQVSYMSNESVISDVSLVEELVSYFNGLGRDEPVPEQTVPEQTEHDETVPEPVPDETVPDETEQGTEQDQGSDDVKSTKTLKSMESMFRMKKRKHGELALSQHSLKLESGASGTGATVPGPDPVPAIWHPGDGNISNKSSDYSLKHDSYKLAKKYLPSDLFRTLNGIFDKKDESGDKKDESGDKKDESCGESGDIPIVNSPIKSSVSQYGHKNKEQFRDAFRPEKLEMIFREELANDKVVPLSNVLFNTTARLSPEVSAMNQVENVSTSYTGRNSKRQTIKDMLTMRRWRTPKISDSAELEDRVFSPGTHRPSTFDVPSIHQVEEELEEEMSPLDRMSSGLSQVFETWEPNLQPESDTSEPSEEPSEVELSGPVPIIKQSRLARGFRRIRAKSLHVRFLSPLHSPLTSLRS